MFRFPCPVLRLAAFAFTAVALNATPAHAQWRRLDSPNFVIIGDVSARDLRDVAVQFEGFRETLGRVLSARVTTTTVPTVVVVFPSDQALAPFRPKYQGKPVEIAGLFVPGRDVNHILLVNDGRYDRLPVVLHEYTHLIASNSDIPLPVWLGEGLAEYYSTFQLERGGREAVLGGLIDNHLARLNDTVLIPLNDLLNINHESSLYNEGSRRSVLYAQSWALTHLILLGEPNRTKELGTYLGNLSSGQAPADAWQGAFGALNMQRELENYIRRQLFRAYKFKFSDGVAKFEAPAAAIPPADVQAYLADLLVRLDDADGAAARLAQARKLDPTNARATVVAARLGLAKQQTDGEAARLRALPTPADWLLSYLAGMSLVQVGETRTGPAEDREAARRFLNAAHAGRADIPRAVAELARMEFASDANLTTETLASLTRIRETAPGRYEYAFLYAQALARQSEFARAREVVAPFLTPAYPLRIRDSARSLMGFLVDAESGRASARSLTIAGQPPAETRESISLPVTRPQFRELKPGEERTEGVLDGFECVQGRGVTFSVKVGNTVVSAVAPTFNDIEFITYRDDLGGSVTCGPLKTPMAVYLTWRKGADGTSRIAVAIEFLPKPPALLTSGRSPRALMLISRTLRPPTTPASPSGTRPSCSSRWS